MHRLVKRRGLVIYRRLVVLACKHKNLVIHINTHTWGQVSRYECLTTPRIASVADRFTQFRRRHGSRCAWYRRENFKRLEPRARNLFEPIDHRSNTFISICVYMKTRTTYDLRQAWKKARAKPYYGIFSCF